MFISRVLFAATGAVAVNALTDQCDSGDEMCLVSVEAQKTFEAAEAQDADTDLMQESSEWSVSHSLLSRAFIQACYAGKTTPVHDKEFCDAAQECEDKKDKWTETGYCDTRHDGCTYCVERFVKYNHPIGSSFQQRWIPGCIDSQMKNREDASHCNRPSSTTTTGSSSSTSSSGSSSTSSSGSSSTTGSSSSTSSSGSSSSSSSGSSSSIVEVSPGQTVTIEGVPR